MYLFDIVKNIDGNFIKNKKNNLIGSIKIDSRLLNDGDLFICLKGDNFDGHDFIDEVKHIKLSGIIVEKDISVKTSIPIIKVKNTYDTLLDLARYIRSLYDIPFIGVTGSVGKTTTKELIYKILSNKYKVLKNEKNLNNHIGVPKTLFNLDETYDMCVIEMGMNHAGEIKKLSRLIKPETSIITNIGTAHIGILGSKENIFKAKMEIIDGMSDGTLILNGDDTYLKKVNTINNINVIKCGTNKTCNLYAYKVKCLKTKTKFSIKLDNKEYKVEFNIPGIHLISDVLLSIKCGLIYNIPIESIIETINSFSNVDSRMEIINIENNNILIKDYYNASYESIIGALNVIKRYKNKKLIILGDILEIGSFNDDVYKSIKKKLMFIRNKEVLLVGNNKIGNYKRFESVDKLNEYLAKRKIVDTVILIKGSRKIHLENVKIVEDR